MMEVYGCTEKERIKKILNKRVGHNEEDREQEAKTALTKSKNCCGVIMG